ncbi:flagellar motor protein [uncultured Thioclava sp.]|jgi:chemotaxis protein MotA|uniref:Flagellar motor protein n=1 Tax=Thioclava arctica TaxID=3238301 RepID=A0ABV3TNT8_9RHOB|nr:flagellar motor protein [uncultured Thioclava sp.]
MSAILGILLGISAIILTSQLEGDPLLALFKVDAAVIVFGGSISALLVHAEWRSIVNAVKQASWLVKPPPTDTVKLIGDMYDWAGIMRSSSALALEDAADEVDDQFLKVGLGLIVAGQSYEEVRDVLYTLGDIEDRENGQGGEIWEAAGGYAPTIGVLGAVLGLIHVMLRLNHPDELGPGIATAFVATIYGVGAANLVFFPLGNRLKAIAGGRTTYREMATEGLLQLSKGTTNPMRLRERLENMLESRRRSGLDQETEAEGENVQDQKAG